jgi:hypothetical protein
MIAVAMYNTGPFDGDGPQDLLELYAELTDAERKENLRAVFLGGPRHPDGPYEPVDQVEVVAGAALVARALPGGAARVDAIPQMDWEEELAAAQITAPEPELVRIAHDALVAVQRDEDWFRSWLSAEDRADSRHTITTIVDVLAAHLA